MSSTNRPRLTRLKPAVQLLAVGLGTALGGSWSDSHRGSRHARGYGSEWDRLRLRVLKRDQYLCQCQECRDLGRIRPATEVDHIVNKAQGGTDDMGNLQAINAACHRVKTAREAAEGRGGGGTEAKRGAGAGPTVPPSAGFIFGR